MRRVVLLAVLVGCAGSQARRAESPLEQPGGLSDDASPALLARSRAVAASVADARDALSAGDAGAAQAHLDRASGEISDLRRDLPGANLLREIDDVGVRLAPGGHDRVDMEPVAQRAAAEALFLDPDVVSGVRQAGDDLSGGRRPEAFEALRGARERLAADITAPALDDALRQVTAAEDAFKRGRMEKAQELLAGAVPAVDELRLRVPLVPVRFDLRAAAFSAELGEWERARRFVARAADRLESLTDLTDAPELPALLREAQRLREAIEARNLPRASDIRWLAARTRLPSRG